MTAVADAAEATRKLIELETQKVKLLEQLLRGLLIAQLMDLSPKEMGKVSTYVEYGNPVPERWKRSYLVVLHEGTDHRFPLPKVPDELWPADLLQARKNHEARSRRSA